MSLEDYGLKKTSERRPQLIEWAQTQEGLFPGCYIAADFEGDGVELSLTVKRPETDAEYGARIASENIRAHRAEELERETYQRLRAKYG